MEIKRVETKVKSDYYSQQLVIKNFNSTIAGGAPVTIQNEFKICSYCGIIQKFSILMSIILFISILINKNKLRKGKKIIFNKKILLICFIISILMLIISGIILYIFNK